jgi:O-antigen/teichoic acid export membrane protein
MSVRTAQVVSSAEARGLATGVAQREQTPRSPYFPEREQLLGRAGLALRGSAWSIGAYAATQLIRTAATLVLARHFLGPEAFGVVGLVAVFVAGLSMFSEVGVVASIVQHPRGEDPRFLNTAFSVQAARGVGIWLIAAAAGYPLAIFYRQPELFPLLVIAGLAELVRGLASTAAWTLTRQVRLRSVSLLAILAEIGGCVLSIVWALMSPSAWALVARTVASAAVYALGSHLIAKPAVRFAWDRSAASDILQFGGWISLATGAHFLAAQGERLFLGKLISAAELGCLSLALMICSVPAGGVNQLVSQIVLPMFSSAVRLRRTEMTRDFLRSRSMFFGFAILVAVGFVLCGRPLVQTLLPPEYELAGWMLEILGIRVALDVFAAPASSLLLAHGQSQYSATANATRLMLMISGIWFSFELFGLHAAVISLVVAQALSYFPVIAGVGRVLPEAARPELRWYAMFLLLLGIAASVSLG